MRIVVAVKYVPDIHADRRFDAGRVVRSSEEGTLNELDENAIEAALRIVESLPQDEQESSEVVVLTMAGPEADTAIRKAYQMGVGRGVRVSDEALAGSDYFGTVATLAAAVRRLSDEAPVDLVITGMAALDGLGSVVPVLLAAELGLPQLTLASELSVTGAGVRVRRDIGDAVEVLQAPLPALVSVTDQANEPRYPAFKAIRAARKKPVDTWSLADLGLADVTPATTVLSAQPRAGRDQGRIVTDSGDGGRQLAEFLIESRLV